MSPEYQILVALHNELDALYPYLTTLNPALRLSIKLYEKSQGIRDSLWCSLSIDKDTCNNTITINDGELIVTNLDSQKHQPNVVRLSNSNLKCSLADPDCFGIVLNHFRNLFRSRSQIWFQAWLVRNGLIYEMHQYLNKYGNINVYEDLYRVAMQD